MMCTCGKNMTKIQQPDRFGQKFTFWKCPVCGAMVKEKICVVSNGLHKQADTSTKPSD
jgi:rRNA maturation protein Nop10